MVITNMFACAVYHTVSQNADTNGHPDVTLDILRDIGEF